MMAMQELSMHELDTVQGGAVPQWMRDAWNKVKEHAPRVIDTIVPDSVSVGPFSWEIPDPFGTGGYNRR